MFHLLVSGMQAYNQVGLLFGALVCLGFGGLIAGGTLYSHVHAIRAKGTIIGVIASGNVYTPVYRYTSPDGTTHVAKAGSGSNLVHGKRTGRVVPLLISSHNPSEASQANDYSIELIGLVFALPGVWLAYVALTSYPITPMTWFMSAAMILYLAERGLRIFKRKGPHLSFAQWRDLIRQGTASDVDLSQVMPIESIVPAEMLEQTWRDQLAAQRRYAPVLALFAAALLSGGVYFGAQIFRLETSGLRATGEVVRLAEDRSSNGRINFHAIVRFRGQDGETVEFRDPVGGNPPALQPGETVRVLYRAGVSGRMQIVDRGIVGNAFIPAILIAIGGLLAWIVSVMAWSFARNPATGGLAQMAHVPGE